MQCLHVVWFIFALHVHVRMFWAQYVLVYIQINAQCMRMSVHRPSACVQKCLCCVCMYMSVCVCMPQQAKTCTQTPSERHNSRVCHSHASHNLMLPPKYPLPADMYYHAGYVGHVCFTVFDIPKAQVCFSLSHTPRCVPLSTRALASLLQRGPTKQPHRRQLVLLIAHRVERDAWSRTLAVHNRKPVALGLPRKVVHPAHWQVEGRRRQRQITNQ